MRSHLFMYQKNKGIKPEQIKAKLRGEISNYKIPKIWYCVTEIPRNSQGKVEINKLNRRC